MVGAGMLQRSPGATDKRTVEFTLTPQGAQLVAQWRMTNTDLLLSAIADLGAREQKALTRALPVLEHLVAVIDAQADRPTAAATRGPST